MAAMDLAEQCFTTNQISKDFLKKLVEKDYLSEGNINEILEDKALSKYITSDKHKRRTSKQPKVSDTERNDEDYNPDKRPCRVWKSIGGIGLPKVQCTRKLPDGELMCKMHGTKADEHGKWWLGLVTEAPPAEPVFQPGKKKAHWWNEEAKEAANQERKSAKKSMKKKSEESDEGDEKPKKKASKKVVKKKSEESDEVEEEPKKKVKKKVKKVEKVDSDEEDEDEEEPKKKVKKEEKIDSDEEEEEEDKVEKKKEEDEEDDDGNTPFIFEGVKYVRTEDGDIVNPDNYDLMGEDDGSGGIDWTDGEMEEKHQQLVAELE